MNMNDALCNACLVPIIENTTFYKCKFNDEGCNFVLHGWCTRLPAELKGRKYHQEHTLLLFPKAGHEFLWFKCRACRNNCNGFGYSCVQCDYKIDVWCAFIRAKITHKSHPNHLLALNISSKHQYDRSSEDDYCRMCLSSFAEPGEISFSCGPCGFHLHVGCALLLPEKIRHRYDKHPLSLAYSPVENHEGDYFCEVCEEEFNPNACFYHCHECVQSIDTTCAPILLPQSKPYLYGGLRVLRRQRKMGGIYKTEYHPHPLSFLYGTSDGDCAKCGIECFYDDILKCAECKFAIHKRCLT
ncbi:putative chromatin regulator PHD family [Helianthus annuus]|nr:putative chromatin regulator PHD family [Helianthus annuus]